MHQHIPHSLGLLASGRAPAIFSLGLDGVPGGDPPREGAVVAGDVGERRGLVLGQQPELIKLAAAFEAGHPGCPLPEADVIVTFVPTTINVTFVMMTVKRPAQTFSGPP
jgi:hypothetical protein